MSYPPNYGYPQPGGQYPPPAAGGGGIGFEGLAASTPSYPAGPGYPQGGHAPYPNVSLNLKTIFLIFHFLLPSFSLI